MKSTYLIPIVAVMVMASCPPLLAGEWTRAISTEYVLGDGESKASARQATIEQLKRMAAAAAGTYVQSTTVLADGADLKESVEVLSASVVRLDAIQENLAVNAMGQVTLKISARASVDEGELVRRINAMREDQNKTLLVERVKSENNALRRDLDEIRSALRQKLGAQQSAELLLRQNRSVDALIENDRKVVRAFAPGGLLQAALDDQDRLVAAQSQLREQVIHAVMDTPVVVELNGAEQNGDGFFVRVRVRWRLDAEQLARPLKQYLNLQVVGNDIHISARDNIAGRGPSAFSERVFNSLADEGVDLKISVGSAELRIPVLYAGYEPLGTCGPYGTVRSAKTSYICLVSRDDRSAGLFTEKGPLMTGLVRIPIQKADALEASSVTAQFVAAARRIPSNN